MHFLLFIISYFSKRITLSTYQPRCIFCLTLWCTHSMTRIPENTFLWLAAAEGEAKKHWDRLVDMYVLSIYSRCSLVLLFQVSEKVSKHEKICQYIRRLGYFFFLPVEDWKSVNTRGHGVYLSTKGNMDFITTYAIIFIDLLFPAAAQSTYKFDRNALVFKNHFFKNRLSNLNQPMKIIGAVLINFHCFIPSNKSISKNECIIWDMVTSL